MNKSRSRSEKKFKLDKIGENSYLIDSGFTSDYYSFHTTKRRRSITDRKFSALIDIENSNEESDKLKKYYKRIFCITTGFQSDLKNIIVELNKISDSTFFVSHIDQHKNVTILKFPPPHNEKLIFIFEFGIVIMWSFDSQEEKEVSEIFFKNCKYLMNSKYFENKNENLKDMDKNIFYYKKGETFTISHRNKITIESNDLTEKLSVTYALAQNTILKYYEIEVSNTIEGTKKIPIDMRDKGVINLTKKEISQNIGLIFMRRSAINLNSDILDTPDIFWEQKNEMESYYSTIRKYFEMNKRIEILNRRMKILKELYDVMNNEIKTQGKFRLEWIVVYLIVIEIFVSLFWKMLVKDILKLY